jgi:hypothetical protein
MVHTALHSYCAIRYICRRSDGPLLTILWDSTAKYHYLQHWKLSWNPEHSWYWQSYLPILFKALHNNTTNERHFNPKIELKWHMRCVWTTQHQDFSMDVHGEFLALNHPFYNFHQWQLPWEALAKTEFTCHCHLSLKSAKLKCVSNVTIYNLPSAGMISHLGSIG